VARPPPRRERPTVSPPRSIRVVAEPKVLRTPLRDTELARSASGHLCQQLLLWIGEGCSGAAARIPQGRRQMRRAGEAPDPDVRSPRRRQSSAVSSMGEAARLMLARNGGGGRSSDVPGVDTSRARAVARRGQAQHLLGGLRQLRRQACCRLARRSGLGCRRELDRVVRSRRLPCRPVRPTGLRSQHPTRRAVGGRADREHDTALDRRY
jgi:hypothetical protein